jgi:methylthioribose-1-phosphate isomerase
MTTPPPATLEWRGDAHTGFLRLLDQTRLPTEEVLLDCRTTEEIWQAIRRLSVRGAPAIGVTAAYGVVIGLQSGGEPLLDEVERIVEYLASSRPTAVNLFWALERIRRTAREHADLARSELTERLFEEARAIEREDRAMCAAMGRHGADLLQDGDGVLTHCNAGSLATAGDGTALSVIFAAVRAGKNLHVFADETRPLLQGARLTSWELHQRGIPVTVICDSMAGWVMREGRIQAVVTGADRIAANGDAANKIGTYAVAVLARAHDIPFYVAAPSSTFDFALDTGEQIPIEQRAPEEITAGFGLRTVPPGVEVYNPAFDVTPARLISGLITERGVIAPVTPEAIRRTLGGASCEERSARGSARERLSSRPDFT